MPDLPINGHSLMLQQHTLPTPSLTHVSVVGSMIACPCTCLSMQASCKDSWPNSPPYYLPAPSPPTHSTLAPNTCHRRPHAHAGASIDTAHEHSPLPEHSRPGEHSVHAPMHATHLQHAGRQGPCIPCPGDRTNANGQTSHGPDPHASSRNWHRAHPHDDAHNCLHPSNRHLLRSFKSSDLASRALSSKSILFVAPSP